MDRAAIQTTLPVIESICHSARLVSSSGSLSFLGPLVPPMAHSVFLGAMVLIRLGDVVMRDPEWPSKVQMLRSCLEVFAKRWKIAGKLTGCDPKARPEADTLGAEKHLQALNAAFQTHLNQLHSR